MFCLAYEMRGAWREVRHVVRGAFCFAFLARVRADCVRLGLWLNNLAVTGGALENHDGDPCVRRNRAEKHFPHYVPPARHRNKAEKG